jgi:tetratricopeptide (TPR) repeat protein
MDRQTESRDVLDPESGSIEEKIVFGLLDANAGETDKAHTKFVTAVDRLGTHFIQDFGWTRILMDELLRIGDSSSAIKVGMLRNEVLGADPQNKVDFARIILEAGDPISSTDIAYLAYALSPQSIDAKEILANALQESDSPAEALAHWNVLAETDNTAILQVARCALEAGYIDLAIHTADSLLNHETYASDAKIIIGEAYRLNGDVSAAIEHFESVTQEMPHNAKAWIALAECLNATGDREAAGHTIATAIQMNPSDAHLHLAQALWLEGEDRLSEALESVEKAYGIDPKAFDIQITYGGLLRNLGHHKKSLTVLNKAVAQKPYHWRGLNATARVQAALGKHEDALTTISNLPASAAPEAHLTAGELTIQAARDSGDVGLATSGVGHLEFAIKAGFDDPRINHWLGVAHETSEEFEKAFKAYQSSLKNLPDDEYELILDSKVGLGRSALAIGQTTLATSLLEDAQRRNQKSISLLVALSQAYLQSQKQGKAFEAAEHALDIDPSDRRAIQQITKVAAETNNWALAMQSMKKLVDLRPLDPGAWITYAESASHAKNIPEARNALAQALTQARSDPFILGEVARVMVDLDLPHSAIRCLQRAIKVDPDNVRNLRALAHAAELTGDKVTSQRAWSRCVEIEPNNSALLEKAADAYWQLGLRAGAIDLWSKAHRFEPTSIPLQITLASAHVALGDNSLGLEFLGKVIEKNPDDIDLAVECAKFAIDFDEAPFALSVLEEILRKAPMRNDVLLALAETYLTLNRNQKASEVLESIIIEPTPPDCWQAICAIAAHRKDSNKRAVAYYQAGSNQVELSPRHRILLSKVALELGKWDEALELVDREISEATPWQTNLARANIRIRIHELSEIFNIANVVAHNPSNSFSEAEDQHSIDEMIDFAITALAPKQTVEVARLRNALASHSLDSNLWNDALLTLQSKPSAIVLEALAIASTRAGNHQETVETIALRDDLGVESDWLDILAGISQHALGQFSASEKSFSRVDKNQTLLPLSMYLSAKSLSTLEERDSAIDHLRSAIDLWPEEAIWQFQLGKLFTLAGNLDFALPHLQEASELSPSNSVYRMTLAKALKESGHLSQAYEYYQVAIEENPSDGGIWLEAGQLALAMGEFTEAEHYYQRAFELLPSEPVVLTGAAKAALALGNPKSAMKMVRSAMQMAPEEPEVLVTLGEILAHQGKIDKALQSFDLAIPKLKDPLPLRIARARLLVKANSSSKAMEEMKALAELYPENEEIWAGYAEICEETNNLVIGVEAANKASNLSPNNPEYHLLLARLSRKSGQLDRALAELSKLEQKNPTNSKVLTELGMLYEDRRQYTEALDAFRRSIACNGNSPIPYLRAGVVLKHLKIYPQAGEMLGKAVELNPQDHEALHQLAAVRALELVHGGIREMAVTT